MAQQDETKVTQKPSAVGAADASPAKVQGAKLAHQDEKLAGGRPDGHILTAEPQHEADQSSLPTKYAPIERPPVSTTRPDVAIAVSLATGAGEHMPPDPEKYDAAGRPRD